MTAKAQQRSTPVSQLTPGRYYTIFREGHKPVRVKFLDVIEPGTRYEKLLTTAPGNLGGWGRDRMMIGTRHIEKIIRKRGTDEPAAADDTNGDD